MAPAPALAPGELSFLRALAARLVPVFATFDGEAAARFEAIVASAVAQRPPSLRRQLRLFLKVLRWAPLLRFGAPLERLPPERQDAVLGWFERSRLRPLRLGFWGVKTIVFMGTYGQPELSALFGYRPVRDGNDALARARDGALHA